MMGMLKKEERGGASACARTEKALQASASTKAGTTRDKGDK